MWKCSNCGEICISDFCDRCGLPKEESVFDEIEETVKEEFLSDESEALTKNEDKLHAVDECGDDVISGKSDETECLDVDATEYTDHMTVLDEYDDYLDEDAYVEPLELVESKTAKSKRASKAEGRREKRVAELENRLREEKNNKHQIPESYKYEVKIKQLKTLFITAIAVVVAVCVGLVFVLNYVNKKKSEEQLISLEKMNVQNSEQKVKINGLESEINSMKSQIESLKEENDILGELNESVRILESDGTYHMYGCDEIDSGITWIYGKDQVVGNSRYIKCEKCN